MQRARRLLALLTLLLFTSASCVAQEPAPALLQVHGTLIGPYELDSTHRGGGIVDGDTIRVMTSEGSLPVRLIGIDTPETTKGKNEPFGAEATDFIRLLLTGRGIFLELDVTPRDRYDRLLAYVYYRDDEGAWEYEGARYTQANHALLWVGYAFTLTIAPNVRYVDFYRAVQEDAKSAGRGMWAEQ
jgi:micrococcal nuclease